MADYSIKIMNQSGDSQSYMLFQEAPKAQGIPANQVFTNVYQAAPGIQTGHNSHALFKMHKTFYCVCGTNPDPLAIDHSVTTSAAEAVNLTEGDIPGSKVFLTAPGNNPQWDDSRTSTTTAANGFAIVTDTNFQYPNESKRLLFQALEPLFHHVGANICQRQHFRRSWCKESQRRHRHRPDRYLHGPSRRAIHGLA
jgi:hypothetical protein